jgi:uncharacterized membrane protein YphA (DoxX/SURF4 family)
MTSHNEVVTVDKLQTKIKSIRYCCCMKRVFLALILLTTILPAVASAHTRWFAYTELAPLETTEPTGLYLLVWSLLIFIVISIALFFHLRGWLNLSFLKPKSPHAFERAASTFTMVVGAFLIIAGTHQYLFSPNLTIENGIPMYLIVIQILIGLDFLLGLSTRVSAIILALLWTVSFNYAGVIPMFENIWVLSTAMFIAVMGNDYFSIASSKILRDKLARYKNYGLSFLRIGTGLTLVILGLTEKILAPEYGINFLNQHHWNFMQMIGFSNYSDYLFTISAGSVELLFGLIFLLGTVTRLNALVVAVVFSLPLFILGPIELSGHLPHFAAIILLLLFGSGGHFVPFKYHKSDKV